MPTIKDVAVLAGVSHETVSNVLNGAGNVSLDKMQRVLQAVETLNYRKDGLARSMQGNQINMIPIILPNITDSLSAQFFTTTENHLQEHG